MTMMVWWKNNTSANDLTLRACKQQSNRIFVVFWVLRGKVNFEINSEQVSKGQTICQCFEKAAVLTGRVDSQCARSHQIPLCLSWVQLAAGFIRPLRQYGDWLRRDCDRAKPHGCVFVLQPLPCLSSRRAAIVHVPIPLVRHCRDVCQPGVRATSFPFGAVRTRGRRRLHF